MGWDLLASKKTYTLKIEFNQYLSGEGEAAIYNLKYHAMK